MIIVNVGDLLDKVKVGNILHGCNAQGVMGGGFALHVKNMYPVAYTEYRQRYESRGLTCGVSYKVDISPTLKVWNMISQEYYGIKHEKFEYELLKSCFSDFLYKLDNDLPIHMPLIGCGLAKGKINIAIPIICDMINDAKLNAYVWVLNETLAEEVKSCLRGISNV